MEFKYNGLEIIVFNFMQGFGDRKEMETIKMETDVIKRNAAELVSLIKKMPYHCTPSDTRYAFP